MKPIGWQLSRQQPTARHYPLVAQAFCWLCKDYGDVDLCCMEDGYAVGPGTFADRHRCHGLRLLEQPYRETAVLERRR